MNKARFFNPSEAQRWARRFSNVQKNNTHDYLENEPLKKEFMGSKKAKKNPQNCANSSTIRDVTKEKEDNAGGFYRPHTLPASPNFCNEELERRIWHEGLSRGDWEILKELKK